MSVPGDVGGGLVTDEVVQLAVTSAWGADARAVTWSIEPLTASFCVVCTVKVQVTEDGGASPIERRFIAKHSPGRTGDPFQFYRNRAFRKEAFFFRELTPLLNEVLQQAGDSTPLRVPRCHYADCTEGRELLLMDDLRTSGFVTCEQWKLDDAHARLVLREAARLHAASLLLQEEEDRPLADRFPLLVESWMLDSRHREPFEAAVLAGSQQMARRFCRAPHLAELKVWLESAAPLALQLIMGQLQLEGPCTVITHGDLHSKNVLFKYDSCGKPIDVQLVDLQVTRLASLSADLSYLIHFTIPATSRRGAGASLLSGLLDDYHSALCALLPATLPPPCTRQRLAQEMQSNRTGLFLALFMLPIATVAGNAAECWQEETPTVQAVDGEPVASKESAEASTERKVLEEQDEKSKTDEDKQSSELRDGISEILEQLAEEVYALGIHRQYADISKFAWKQ